METAWKMICASRVERIRISVQVGCCMMQMDCAKLCGPNEKNDGGAAGTAAREEGKEGGVTERERRLKGRE